MTGLEAADGTVLAIGGMSFPMLFTVVTIVFTVITAIFMVAIAIGPHVSSSWAERFHGAIPDVDGVEPDDGEEAA